MKGLVEYEVRALAAHKRAQETIERAKMIEEAQKMVQGIRRAPMEQVADVELMAESAPPDQLARLGMRGMEGAVHNLMPGSPNFFGATLPNQYVVDNDGKKFKEQSISGRDPKVGDVYLATDYISHDHDKNKKTPALKIPVSSDKQKNTMRHEGRHRAFASLRKEGFDPMPRMLRRKLGAHNGEEFMMRVAELRYSDLSKGEKLMHERFLKMLTPDMSETERKKMIQLAEEKLKDLQGISETISDTRNDMGALGG